MSSPAVRFLRLAPGSTVSAATVGLQPPSKARAALRQCEGSPYI